MRINAMVSLLLQYVKDNRLESITADEYLALLTDYEWEDHQNQKIDRFFAMANFSQKANLVEVNYAQLRNLNKNRFERLGTLDFIKRKENVILTGASGFRKS